MEWRWKQFEDLTVSELYEVVELRERVFIVEQNCVYLDSDGADRWAWHLMGYSNGKLVAYLRALPQGVKYPDCSIGRIVTAAEVRKTGWGKELVKQGIARIDHQFGRSPIRISAQAYLEKFYSEFAFRRVSENYLEDNIPHLEMLRD